MTTVVESSDVIDLLAATALGLAFVSDASDVSVLIDLSDDGHVLTAAQGRVLSMPVGDPATRHAAAQLLANAALHGAPSR